MRNLILVLTVLTAVAYADPSGCTETPATWSGVVRQIYWNASDLTSIKGPTFSVAYSRKDKKFKTQDMELIFPGDKRTVLDDYSSGTKYESVRGKCTRSKLSGDIPSFGVEEDAKFNVAEYIGAELPNLGVLVNEYWNIVPEKTIYLASNTPVSGEECVPVLYTNMVTTPKLAMDLRLYINMTTSLPDDPFKLPEGC